MKEIEHRATGLDDLRRCREQLQVKAQRLTDAVAEAGHSTALLSKLATIEAQIADVDQQMTLHKTKDLCPSLGEVRQFVYTSVLQLKELLRGDPATLKAVLARHIGQLTLNPTQTPQGSVYEVSGGVDLLPHTNDVMQVVARDGIARHYTFPITLPLTGIQLDPKQSSVGPPIFPITSALR